MSTAHRTDHVKATRLLGLLREPTLHFFLIAGAILLAQRLQTGDPLTIEISPALRADLLRRYQDQLNRAPTSAETDAFLAAWKAEEALYREALREGMDRDDPVVRSVLIGRMRERILLRTRMREPSEEDLRDYLERHREQFEAPLMYEHEYVVLPKREPGVEHRWAQLKRQLTAGATPASLGLRSTAANVNRQRIEGEFGAEVAAKICQLPIGQWHELETNDRLLLVRMIGIQGGMPEPEVLHARLVAAWKSAKEQHALAEATRAITGRYRIEETSD